MFRKKLTEVAVESVTEYLEEKLEYLKTLDLDKDGQKDVDQITEIVKRCRCKGCSGYHRFCQDGYRAGADYYRYRDDR